MKDDACTVRDIEVCGEHNDVAGFVRILDRYEDDAGSLHLLVLCDADPIVWRLRFEVVDIGGSPGPCLTGLWYVGHWTERASIASPSGAAVFMHPPTRAADTLWKPHQADMTLVNPERK